VPKERQRFTELSFPPFLCDALKLLIRLSPSDCCNESTKLQQPCTLSMKHPLRNGWESGASGSRPSHSLWAHPMNLSDAYDLRIVPEGASGTLLRNACSAGEPRCFGCLFHDADWVNSCTGEAYGRLVNRCSILKMRLDLEWALSYDISDKCECEGAGGTL